MRNNDNAVLIRCAAAEVRSALGEIHTLIRRNKIGGEQWLDANNRLDSAYSELNHLVSEPAEALRGLQSAVDSMPPRNLP